MPNQLIHSLSPYLLQHAHNPVDWHPWGEAALAKAKAEQKPIFLSIGYSACHWCHVMERESFEDPAVAAVLNAAFVPIKVDREERPDLDDLYMDAVQAITGRGGWPMSVWLTPDLEPFHGGTYFPPEARQGMPGFRSLLERIAEVWATDRDQLRQQAGGLTQQLRRAAELLPGEVGPGDEVLEAALLQLRQSYDARWGGFGPAPKFPQAMAVELILARGSATDRAMARRTLDAMGDGGMYDHLGGGFARYSVDGQWLVPHFEKMLYDNAQLATCYLAAFQAFGEPRYAQVARETLDYLIRDLRDPAGGFHAAEDADSEGEEGRFYVFTPTQVVEALGPADAARFCAAYGVTEAGNFEHGQSVLHRFSAASNVTLPEVEDAALRLRLRQWRDRRVRPAKDDKVLAAWNGLALAALARGAQVLGDARYLEAAQACATFLRRELWTGRGLLRVWRGGQAHTPAFLEDEAAVADGLVDLFETDFDPAWLRWAEALGEGLLARFHDPVGGGFYSTLAGQGDLIFRQKPGFDQALPSGNTLAARALLRLSRHLQRQDFREAAEGVLQAFGPWMARAPRAFLGLLAVLDSSRRAPLELSLSGRPGDPEVELLLRAIHARHLPGRTLTVSDQEDLPLHKGRQRGLGRIEAFACRGSVCTAPTQGAAALEALLDGPFARS